MGVAPRQHQFDLRRLIFYQVQHVFHVQQAEIDGPVDLVKDDHVESTTGDRSMCRLHRLPGQSYILLVRVLAVHPPCPSRRDDGQVRGQLRRRQVFTVRPATLEELYHAHHHFPACRAQRQTEGGSGLTFTVAGVYLNLSRNESHICLDAFSASFEDRRPLLQERPHPLFLVIRRETEGKGIPLNQTCIPQIDVEPRIDHFLRQPE